MVFYLGKTKQQGATGVEPVTSRSAVECSATELYPQHDRLSTQIKPKFSKTVASDQYSHNVAAMVIHTK